MKNLLFVLLVVVAACNSEDPGPRYDCAALMENVQRMTANYNEARKLAGQFPPNTHSSPQYQEYLKQLAAAKELYEAAVEEYSQKCIK